MSSFLLNFAYAETLEVAQNFSEVHAVFDKFLEVLRRDLEALETRISSAGSSNSNLAINDSQADTTLPNEGGTQSNSGSFQTQPADDRPPKSKELADRRTEYGLVWTMYMRFARRAEGLKSFRAVFAKARRDRWTPWQIYESAGAYLILYITLYSRSNDLCMFSSCGISLHEGCRRGWAHFRKGDGDLWGRSRLCNTLSHFPPLSERRKQYVRFTILFSS